jgi:uncharacterized membrane protein YjgN (DUF898 family)
MAVTTCPRCGSTEVRGDGCPQCGVKLSLYLASLEKMRRPPTPPTVPVGQSVATPTRTGSPPTAPPVQPSRPASVAPAPDKPGTTRRFMFHGSAGTLFGIWLVNILLTLVTLGVYRFWGKVRVRRYVLSQASFDGDRFAYHGTGKELLVGFVKAALFIGLPIAAMNLAGLLSGDKLLSGAARVLTWGALMVVLPMAMVGARRYRLSRTSWRGIRFSFRGAARDFVKIFLAGAFLTPLTLGLYYPTFETRRHAFFVSHAYLGQRRFRFDGRSRDLFWSYLAAVLLTIPTLGLYWFWFDAKKTRYFWEHTSFEGARFRSTVTGRLLLNLTVGNLLLLLVTLGLAWPLAVVRNARLTVACLSLAGQLDLAAIVQEPQTVPATGDALSSFFGIDVDLW